MASEFPFAPNGWGPEIPVEIAKSEQIELSDDHWLLIKALQEYFVKHEDKVNFRELHDALEERFHVKGGVKYLYSLFPNGPVTQGCKLAGLDLPAGAVDKGFGSAL